MGSLKMSLTTTEHENFMTYLAKDYPHLFQVQQKIIRIQESTGYGNVFIDIRVANNVADKITVSYSEEQIVKRREGNSFD